MINYNQFLDEYSFSSYSMYSNTIPENEWGNKEIALTYLKKYLISDDEYFSIWEPIRNSIFRNENEGLPSIVFKESFSLLAIRGGVLFEKEDFENLQSCIRKIGDKNLIIVQNDFGGVVKSPLFRMKYPANIKWDELMGGNFISTVMFEMFANEYFVFSESGNCGKYSANDYELPLDIIGFKPEYASIFIEQFKLPKDEMEEIRDWLPPKYKELIKY